MTATARHLTRMEFDPATGWYATPYGSFESFVIDGKLIANARGDADPAWVADVEEMAAQGATWPGELLPSQVRAIRTDPRPAEDVAADLGVSRQVTTNARRNDRYTRVQP